MKTGIQLGVDAVIFTVKDNFLQVLLVKRKKDPFKSEWTLPGGILDDSERLVHSAQRHTEELTSLSGIELEEFSIFDGLHCDPRGRIVSVAFFALINSDCHKFNLGPDAADAGWFPIDEMPSLAADNEEIVDVAYNLLRDSLDIHPLCWQFFKDKFSMGQLQTVYETILQVEIDADDFKKAILDSGFVKEAGPDFYVFDTIAKDL